MEVTFLSFFSVSMKKYHFPHFLLFFCLSLSVWPSIESRDYVVCVTLTNATDETITALTAAFTSVPPSKPKCLDGKNIIFSLPPFSSVYPSLDSISSLYSQLQANNDSEVVLVIGDKYLFDNSYFGYKITTTLTPISPVKSVYGFSYTRDIMDKVLATLYENLFNSLSVEVPYMIVIIEAVESLQPLGGGSTGNPTPGFSGRATIYHFGHQESNYTSICQNILKSGIKNIVVQLRDESTYGLIAEAIRRNLFHWSYRWVVLNANLARTVNDQRLASIYSKNFTLVDITQTPTNLSTKDSIIFNDMATVTRCLLEYGFGCSNVICPSATFLTGNFKFSVTGNEVAMRTSYNFTVYAGPRKTLDTVFATISVDGDGLLKGVNVNSLPLIDTSRQATLDRMQNQNPLRILLMNEPPFVIISIGNNSNSSQSTYPIQGLNLTCSGFAVDAIVKALGNIGVSNYVFNYMPNLTYGTYNGSAYTGAIGLINQQFYDLGLGGFIFTKNINDAVDFLYPVTRTSVSLLYKEATKTFFENFFSFISPFDWKVWAVICGTNMAYALLLWIMHLISPNENNFSLYNSIFFITSTLVQGTVLTSPDRVSGRILTCFWWFFNLALTITYVCSYGSQFTDIRLSVAFAGYKDLLLTDLYDYGTMAETALEYNLGNSPLTVDQLVNQNMRTTLLFDGGLPKTIGDAISAVQDGEYIFIWLKYTNDFYARILCLRSEGAFDQKPIQFPMSKGHEYFSILNDAITSLSTDSTLTQLEAKYFGESVGACNNGTNWLENIVNTLDTKIFPDTSKNSLGYSKMGGIFVITILGCNFTLIVAIIELIAGAISQSRKRKERKKARATAKLGGNNPKSTIKDSRV